MKEAIDYLDFLHRNPARNPTQYAIMRVLIDFAEHHEESLAWPSYVWIAKKIGSTRQTVAKQIDLMEGVYFDLLRAQDFTTMDKACGKVFKVYTDKPTPHTSPVHAKRDLP